MRFDADPDNESTWVIFVEANKIVVLSSQRVHQEQQWCANNIFNEFLSFVAEKHPSLRVDGYFFVKSLAVKKALESDGNIVDKESEDRLSVTGLSMLFGFHRGTAPLLPADGYSDLSPSLANLANRTSSIWATSCW